MVNFVNFFVWKSLIWQFLHLFLVTLLLAEAYFKFFTFLESFLERGAKRVLEKATIMMFTKQDSENNRNVKTQMIVSADNSLNKGFVEGRCGQVKDILKIRWLVTAWRRLIFLKIDSSISIRPSLLFRKAKRYFTVTTLSWVKRLK